MKAISTAELVYWYQQGHGLRTLARWYADVPLSRSAILYRLRRAGVTMRRTGARRGNTNARRITPR